VVLNSLAGDFITRSVDVTAQGGRFVEIGKNQIWTPAHMQEVRPDLGYWCMALDEIITNRPQHIGEMLEQITTRLAAGTLKALPCDSFPIARVVDALRHLAQARHVGKVVVLHGDEAAVQAERPLLQPGGEVLVTGGLGGLGLGLARWLATQGVRALRLAGRSAPSAEAEVAIAQLRSSGLQVTVSRCDVSKPEAVADLLAGMRAQHGRVAAVFHAAGALDDAPLMMLDEGRWRTAIDAKLLGALHLDALTRDDELDAFVLFSSAAGVLGTPGQANYAAANAALDALAQARRQAGRTALSIDWGPWADAGMAARSGAKVQRMWSSMGIAAIAERAGFATLEMLMRQAPAQAVVVHADWAKVARWSPTGSTPPLLLELAGDDGANAAASAEWLAFVEHLKAVTPGERKGLLVEHFRAQVARVLGLKSGSEIDARTPLVDLGLDSLMAVELANQLRATTGAKLRVTQLFDHPSIDALSDYYLKDVLALHEPEPEPVAAPAAPVRTEQLIASIADISDEEVERRLRSLRGDEP
jgi:myxalamid-type polyketide synthase MxaB